MSRLPARLPLALLLALSFALLQGCTALMGMPHSGPSAAAVNQAADVTVVPLTRQAAREASASDPVARLDSLPAAAPLREELVAGDSVEISLWEAAPALLLAGLDGGVAAPSGRGVTLPAQTVRLDGSIRVPFVGQVSAQGRTPRDVEEAIQRGLEGKANRPQVLVRAGSAVTQEVTVVGGVKTNLRFPLTARRERLLDAIALAGGSTFPLEKTTVQLTRGTARAAVPLDVVVRDGTQNVALGAGDVVTVYHQPLSFVALGAVAKPGDVAFEATGLDLAQAVARAGGVLDNRAHAGGVFVSRRQGDSSIVYQLDMSTPGSLFALREFKVRDNDIIYVANAPMAELQKFLTLLGSVVYPIDASLRAVNGDY